jgi:hypothetical protein
MENCDVSREGAKVAKENQDLFIVSFAVFAPSRETARVERVACQP